MSIIAVSDLTNIKKNIWQSRIINCVSIEQLKHVSWIDQLTLHTLNTLIFLYMFSWDDEMCSYTTQLTLQKKKHSVETKQSIDGCYRSIVSFSLVFFISFDNKTIRECDPDKLSFFFFSLSLSPTHNKTRCIFKCARLQLPKNYFLQTTTTTSRIWDNILDYKSSFFVSIDY